MFANQEPFGRLQPAAEVAEWRISDFDTQDGIFDDDDDICQSRARKSNSFSSSLDAPLKRFLYLSKVQVLNKLMSPKAY